MNEQHSKPFLQHVSNWILKHYPSQTDNIIILIPSLRAKSFLNLYLSESIDKPLWQPTVLSIREWVEQQSNQLIADPITLLFELYHAYTKVFSDPVLLDEFITWGENLLNDFDEIDMHLLNVDSLFTHIGDYQALQDNFEHLSESQQKAIAQFWGHFQKEASNDLNKPFVTLWDKAPGLYRSFQESIRSKNITYPGAAFRSIAEGDSVHSKEDESIYLMVGFNYLSPAEKQIFKLIRQNHPAHFFWDYHPEYLEPEWHEAGRFIRQNLKIFPDEEDFRDILRENLPQSDNKEVRSYEFSSHSAQARYAAGLSEHIQAQDTARPDQVAIIFPDESLLLPLVNHLPDNMPTVNITMGFPLRYSNTSNFIEKIIQIHQQALQDKKKRVKRLSILELFLHDYFTTANDAFFKEKTESLLKDQRPWISLTELADGESDLFGMMKHLGEGSSLTPLLLNLCQHFVYVDNSNLPDSERAFFYQILLLIQKLENLQQTYSTEVSDLSQARLLNKLIRQERIPFEGEPLKGIQLMGFLETRLLDFKEIIILSTNEDSFPPSSFKTGFIPLSLKKAYGLPTPDIHDAIHAYHFYRLIQRAEKVHLLYTSNSPSGQKVEPSRYLSQLKYSSKQALSEFKINPYLKTEDPVKIEITKTPEMLQQLLNQNSNQKSFFLSPSAINTYIDCSLKFYFRYVARIKPIDEQQELIDYRYFGIIVHDTLKILYDKQEVLTNDFLKDLLEKSAQIRETLMHEVEANGFAANQVIHTPENEIIFENMMEYILQVIRYDLSQAPIKPISLEKEYQREFQLDASSRWKIKGIIDRVDLVHQTLRIIDYKTGSDEHNVKVISDLFSPNLKKRNKAILQLFIYAYLFESTDDSRADKPIHLHLFNIKKLFSPRPATEITIDRQTLNYAEHRAEFMEHFEALLREMSSDQFAFTQTEEQEICSRCDYVSICGRG